MSKIKELTDTVQGLKACTITWELGSKYLAFDTVTGSKVAEYAPKSGKLTIF